MLSYQIYAHLENRRTFLPQIIVDFPAVWNYRKLSAKFLISSVKVIDTVGFLSFFKSFTRTTIKIPLNCFSLSARTTNWSLTTRKGILEQLQVIPENAHAKTASLAHFCFRLKLRTYITLFQDLIPGVPKERPTYDLT